MNYRTTYFLAFLLVVCALFYFVLKQRTGSPGDEVVETTPVGALAVAEDVLDTELGDLTRIVCQREGEDEWVFERLAVSEDEDAKEWHLTSPLTFKAVTWEIDRIGRQLSGLQYEIGYRAGEAGGITAAEAGLEPPTATVTLTDATGQTATVEIGKPASRNTTYVRVSGKDEIYVGKSSLRDLVKPQLLDYRDKELWSFEPGEAVRVEIVDRSEAGKPVTYAFGLDGKRWMMESPTTAKATSKVDELLRSLSRLRVIKWHDNRLERLAAYGLEEAGLSVRVTVEEKVESPEMLPTAEEGAAGPEGGEAEEKVPAEADAELETRKVVYELHISDQSPIGEDTKVYIRPGDEPNVATIMKTVADKFKPVMSEWRDMRITSANATAADRVEISTKEAMIALIKGDEGWSFDDDAGPAEASVVEELLDAVSNLKAVAFVDGTPGNLAAFGLDQPEAEIRLTIPGVEDVERIAVGGFTDMKTKRLRYARRNEVTSVAKVRDADVKVLTRGPQAYRDRAVFNVPVDSVEAVKLSVENRFGGGRMDATFARADGEWRMSAPVEAPGRTEKLEDLVKALTDLRAEAVVADTGELLEYGLDTPQATVVFGGESLTAAGTGSSQLELILTEHQGKVYAKRGDRTTVYQLPRKIYDQVFEEYRTGETLTFDESAVKRFTIRKGDETHTFERFEDRWAYLAEPDLPLEATKVDNLLLQLKDLKTERYAVYEDSRLDSHGLAQPFHEITVTMEDNSSRVLVVSDQTCPGDSERRLYAAVRDQPGVFLLSKATVERFAVSLDTLEVRP